MTCPEAPVAEEGPTTEPPQAPVRLDYIHSFRAIAIVGVVATHLLERPRIAAPLALLFAKGVVENSTVFFLFIAGFLFQHLSSRFEYGRYLKSKFSHVVVPYLVVSIPAFLLWRPWQHAWRDGNALALLKLSAVGIATGAHNPAPFWFVPLIVALYLAAPLLLALDRRPKLYLLLPVLVVVASLCHRPTNLVHLGQSLIYFTPAYIAGMFLSHFRERMLSLIDRVLAPLAVACVVAYSVQIFAFGQCGATGSLSPFSTEDGVVDFDLAIKLVLSVLLVAFLRRQEPGFHKLLDYLAGASFGIFFVHSFLRDAMKSYVFRHFSLDLMEGWAALLVFTPAVIAGSLAIVWIVRRASGKYSRYLIGC